MITDMRNRSAGVRQGLTIVTTFALLLALAAPQSVAGPISPSGHGVLVADTSPSVPATIAVDGVVRATTQLKGLELPAGDYEVSFHTVDGFLRPDTQAVTVEVGQITRVTGHFRPSGTLAVSTSPSHLAPMIRVEGVDRDRGAATLSIAEGKAEVCGGEVAGYVTPMCETSAIAHGETTEVTLLYEEAPGPGESQPSTPDSDRVIDGLVAFYDFAEGVGSTVKDKLGGLDLAVDDASAVSWTKDGLRIDRPTVARSSLEDDAFRGTIPQAQELALEAWVTPGNLEQRGPARIVALGTGNQEHAILGQGNHTGDSSLVEGRIDSTNLYMSRLMSSPGTLAAAATHMVLTHAADGTETLYLNGQPVVQTESNHDLSNWTGDLQLALADQMQGDRPWVGTYHLVAVYSKALDHGEVQENFLAGPGGSLVEPVLPDPTTAPDPDPIDGPEQPKQSSWDTAWEANDADMLRAWYRANTGIAAAGLSESDLTPSGSFATTHDGQVIEGLLVSGQISVQHDNVTIRNSKITNNGGTDAISVGWGSRNTVNRLNVENVSIIGTGGANEYGRGIWGEWIGLHHGQPTANVGLRASRVYISGFGGGFRMSHFGDDRVDYSMVENIRVHSGSHNTGASFRGGNGKFMSRNWIEGSTSSALSLYPDASPITNFTAKENTFDGGTYSIHAGYSHTFGSTSNHLRYLDNRFTRQHQYGPRASWNPDASGNEWSRNHYFDGTSID